MSSPKGIQVAKALKKLAIRRGAEVSMDTYSVYVDDLMRFNLDDVESACKSIGAEARKSFEKPFPEVGLLISECERLAKHRRDGFTEEKFYSIYECSKCKTTQSGLIPLPCIKCGGWTDCIATDSKFDHTAYMMDVRRNPQNYVKIGDVLQEAMKNMRIL